MNFKTALAYILLILLCHTASAQTDSLKTDSLSFIPTITDSLKSDSLKSLSIIDTNIQVKSDITAPITYSARDSAIFDVKSKKLYLFNDAQLNYQDLKLNSGIILVDQSDETLEAYGIPDSNNTGKLVQTPIMLQGGEKLEGSRLYYSFNTKQGNISMGFSEAEVGYYFGEKIKKVTDEVYFIKNGLYTTSTDKTDPEYYFLSPKMKIVKDDKVIAQSVFLYIEGVPVFWLPFGVFPNKSGRSSGLIPPTYGEDGTYGTYIAKLGYFWAMSDYYDLAATGSFFFRGRIDFNARFRYALKYNFNGSVEGGYSRIRLGEATDLNKFSSDEWSLNVTHSQVFNPTSRVDANLTFASGKAYYDNTSNNLNILLRQNIISNFTYSKSWEGTPYYFSANYFRDQNLITGAINENIPSLNFSISQIYPFQSEYSSSDSKSLLEYFSFSYQGRLLNNHVKNVFQKSLNNVAYDSISNYTRNGVAHGLNFNLSPQSQFISVSPYFSYNELWYSKTIEKRYDPVTNTVINEDVDGFKAARFFNMGVSFGTKLIGIFSPNVFGIKGIRHTITPNITYNYSPDFSKDSWGYYKSYTNALGMPQRYSIFENGIFGGPGAGESQSISFNVSNVFEMKTRETDSTDNKFQLFNIDAGISYNFAADSLKFSELGTSFRTSIGSLLNISGGAVFNLYKFDPVARTRINQFLIKDGKLADLTSFNINLGTSYNFNLTNISVSDTGKSIMFDSVNTLRYNIPLSGSLNYYYSESRFDPTQFTHTSSFSGSLNFNPTEKWRFSVSTSYDLISKQISAPYVTAYRDLNSWEMNFNWYPLGTYKGFNLEIKIKAPQLRDIKVTKSTNPGGPFGF